MPDEIVKAQSVHYFGMRNMKTVGTSGEMFETNQDGFVVLPSRIDRALEVLIPAALEQRLRPCERVVAQREHSAVFEQRPGHWRTSRLMPYVRHNEAVVVLTRHG